MSKKLILASSSKYRANLLKRLISNFKIVAPQIDETQFDNELPQDYVKRLSIEKARTVAKDYPASWVIGSDQIAEFDGLILGKPGNIQKAQQQLLSFSGKQVFFRTGVSIINVSSNTCYYKESITRVYFKQLNEKTIIRYLELDQPYDCAGSFKIESRGVVLFEKIHSDDPTALEGLPLIELCQLFEKCGLAPLGDF